MAETRWLDSSQESIEQLPKTPHFQAIVAAARCGDVDEAVRYATIPRAATSPSPKSLGWTVCDRLLPKTPHFRSLASALLKQADAERERREYRQGHRRRR